MTKAGVLMVLLAASSALATRGVAQVTSKNEQTSKPLAGYQVLVLEKFKIEPAAVQAGFVDEQAQILQAEVILQLRKKKMFDQVIDGSNLPPPDAGGPPPDVQSRLILSATVTEFDPGSRAQRYWVGFGAGAAKLKMQFGFQDAASGKEVLHTDHQHKFWAGTLGGSKNAAMTQTAEGMVKSLVDDIKRNR